MTDNISEEQRAAMLGEVILSARRVESRLHELCGDTEVAGIHALTELLGSRLPDDVKRQLHFIAAVRNSAAHEDSFAQTPDEFKSYQQCCMLVLETLNRLFPDKAVKNSKSEGEKSSLDLAVEKEAFAAMAGKLARLGYWPLLGTVYLVSVLLYALARQGFMLILGGLYICSAVLGIKGWQSSADRGLLYVAGGTLLFAYIAAMFLSFYAPVKKLPKIIGILPGVNILYLVIRFLRDLQWGRFLTAAAGLACLAAAVVMMLKSFYNYAVMALAANWILSLSSALIWGKKHEK